MTNLITIESPGPQGPPGPQGAQGPMGVGNSKADIVLFIESFLSANEALLEYVPSANQSIVNTSGSASVSNTNVSSTNTFINIIVNDSIVGNIVFYEGATRGIFNFPTINLQANDVFQLVNAPTSDPSLSNIRVTLSGTR